MNMRPENYMDLSILLAERNSYDGLKVAALLVSHDDKLICSAWNGEQENTSWNDGLIAKICSLGVKKAASLYLTINTYDASSTQFGLEKVINAIQVDTIYIGLPDPTVTMYIENDPVLTLDTIKRFSDELQYKILYQNYDYYAISPQSICNSPYYHENRISNLVVEILNHKGINITKEELNLRKNRHALTHYISECFGLEYGKAKLLINETISEAFNKKYGTYKYSNDTRSLDNEWENRFTDIFSTTVNRKIEESTIINVGVGGGHEASSLFSKCENITFVDVATDGLFHVQNSIPSAKIINASADNLIVIEESQYDAYISLRTFNSSFFDIAKAVTEAKRILKNNASIIVSVANGFLCAERKCIIPGLLIPGTEFVDIYRGLDTAKLIKLEYLHAGFTDIHLCPTVTEIYLSGTAA